MINADAPRRLTAPALAVPVAAFAAFAAFAALAVPLPGVAASKPKAPPPRYLFAGVPWLVPADTAVARLAERGYRKVAGAGTRDQIVFRGRRFEHDALITGHLDEQRQLVRWVVLPASDL